MNDLVVMFLGKALLFSQAIKLGTCFSHDSVGMEEAVKGKCPFCSKKRNHLLSHVRMHFHYFYISDL